MTHANTGPPPFKLAGQSSEPFFAVNNVLKTFVLLPDESQGKAREFALLVFPNNNQRGPSFIFRCLILLEGSSRSLLGEALVADELGADSLEGRVTLGLHLLDTVTVSLLVYRVAKKIG